MKKGSKRNQKHLLINHTQALATVRTLVMGGHWFKAVRFPNRVWRITVRTELDIDMHTGVLL